MRNPILAREEGPAQSQELTGCLGNVQHWELGARGGDISPPAATLSRALVTFTHTLLLLMAVTERQS